MHKEKSWKSMPMLIWQWLLKFPDFIFDGKIIYQHCNKQVCIFTLNCINYLYLDSFRSGMGTGGEMILNSPLCSVSLFVGHENYHHVLILIINDISDFPWKEMSHSTACQQCQSQSQSSHGKRCETDTANTTCFVRNTQLLLCRPWNQLV